MQLSHFINEVYVVGLEEMFLTMVFFVVLPHTCIYCIIGLFCFIMLKCWIAFFSWTVIDEDCRRWMVHFIHQSGMLPVWLALKHLTQLPGKSTKRNKR